MLSESTTEDWLPIPGFPGYDISDQGNIRSWHAGAGARRTIPKLNKIHYRPGCQPCAQLFRAGVNNVIPVERLMLLTFGRTLASALPPCHTGEEWCAVPGFPGYEVSSCGRVTSTQNQRMDLPYIPRALQFLSGRTGYQYVCLYRIAGEKGQRCAVHRLVLETFVGPCPTGTQTCHNDGDPGNNHLANLRWDSPKNNHADRRQHGTVRSGEAVLTHKLTTGDVVAIREQFAAGELGSVLAARFGVYRRTIGGITSGHTWKDAPGPRSRGIGGSWYNRDRVERSHD